jgi:hypothetical protein
MRKFRATLSALAILLFCGGASAQEGVLINVRVNDLAYSDSHLAGKLGEDLIAHKKVRIIESPRTDLFFDNLESLISFGREHGVRFLAEILVDRMEITTRKKTIIPLILSRYKTEATLFGSIRIIDVARERYIQKDEFKFDIKAADQWQALDHDANDPGLLISAGEKLRLFDKLESRMAKECGEKIRRLSRGNGFGG